MKVNMTNALILNENRHVLVIHNIKNGSDRYEFPGGKTEPTDSSLEETTVREDWEELGIRVRVTGTFGDYKTQTPEGEFLCRTMLIKHR